MSYRQVAMSEPKKVCNTCGGSGEIGLFQGRKSFFHYP